MGNQQLQAEIDANIQVINNWNRGPVPQTDATSTKAFKQGDDLISAKQTTLQSQSSSNNRNYRDKDRLKLSRKNIVFEKPSSAHNKPKISICSPSRIEPSTLKELIPESKTMDLKDIIINKNIDIPKIEQEIDITERVKSKFTRAMNDRLDSMIKDLETYNAKLEQGRRLIKERIADIVKRSFNGNAYIKEYGSFASRLLTPYSDMDISIQGCSVLNRDQITEMLNVLNDNLSLYGFVKKVNTILTAVVPVIKIEADPSVDYECSLNTNDSMVIHVDIIVDTMDGYNPISTALRTTEYMKYCIATYPSFYKNMLLLKYAMSCNELNSAYRGGLCAYGLSVLYVAYIESHKLERSTENFELLKGFIAFLAKKFDPETQAVYFGPACR